MSAATKPRINSASRAAELADGGEGVRPLVPRQPWPLPSALTAAVGIAFAGSGLSWWLLTGLVPVVWLARPLLLQTGDRLGYSRSAVLALLLPVAASFLGYARYEQWRAVPDPSAQHQGRELVLSGVTDGNTLRVEQPFEARLAVSPSGALTAGRVELRGTVREAAGRRNPGGFDYRAHLERRGIEAQVLVAEVLHSEPRRRLLDKLREGVRAGLPGPSAALMEAMTLGVRDELGSLRDTFAAAGLAHVLALSGLHVGLLMAALGYLMVPLGRVRYPLLLGADFGYMFLVGSTPSVVRAALMVAVVLFALWSGAGRVRPWPALGLASLVTLLARPAWLFDISFQLSYGAVAGILMFALPLGARLRGDPPVAWWHPRMLLVAPLLTSAGAQALTLPLVASSFGSIPLFSPLVNLIALPVASLLVPLGFAAGLLGLASGDLARLVNILTEPLAGALLAIAHLGSHLPTVTWGAVEPAGYLYFALATGSLALAVNGVLALRRALLPVTAAIMLSFATPASRALPELVVLDVGQGDSSLLRLPRRTEVLIDGGGTPFSDWDVGTGTVLPALRALGVDELELVIATHSDVDHVEGLLAVLEQMPVQQLVIGHPRPNEPMFERLMEAARANSVAVRQVRRGETVVLGEAGLEILNPPPRSYGSSNDDSVAVLVRWRGEPAALLLGDISERVEDDLVVPPVEVLLAPHHGSRHSSSRRLLQAARPRVVVVSVGLNRYGHPSEEVLARIDKVASTLHLTREQGAARIALER